MSRLVACRNCGARFDLSEADPGELVTCGGCGNVLRAPGTRRDVRSAPGRTRIDPASQTEAKSRLRAAKLSVLSLYLCMGAVVGYLVAGPIAGAVSLAAIVAGIIGRTQLSRLGPGPPVEECRPGIERLASRLVPRAKTHALVGILLGGPLTLFCAVQILITVPQIR